MIATIVVLTSVTSVLVIMTYIGIWRRAKSKNDLLQSDWTKLKDIASYIQSCVTVLVLFLGAGWAVYTWKTQWDDHKESEKAALQVNISAHQEYPPGTTPKNTFFIGGDIVIKNAGASRTKIGLADGPLFVARVHSSKSIPAGTLRDPKNPQDVEAACTEGKIQFDPSQRFWLSRPLVNDPQRPDIELQDEIRPGEEDVFHFVVKVTGPGTYAIIFSSALTDQEEKDALPYPPANSLCPDARKSPHPRWESAAYFVEVTQSKPVTKKKSDLAARSQPVPCSTGRGR